jgi:hypothetical protein
MSSPSPRREARHEAFLHDGHDACVWYDAHVTPVAADVTPVRRCCKAVQTSGSLAGHGACTMDTMPWYAHRPLRTHMRRSTSVRRAPRIRVACCASAEQWTPVHGNPLPRSNGRPLLQPASPACFSSPRWLFSLDLSIPHRQLHVNLCEIWCQGVEPLSQMYTAAGPAWASSCPDSDCFVYRCARPHAPVHLTRPLRTRRVTVGDRGAFAVMCCDAICCDAIRCNAIPASLPSLRLVMVTHRRSRLFGSHHGAYAAMMRSRVTLN